MEDESLLWLLSSLLYGVVLTFILYCALLQSRERKRRSRPLVITLGLCLSLLLRIVWMACHLVTLDDGTKGDDLLVIKLLNRFATLVQFSTVTYMLAGWEDTTIRIAKLSTSRRTGLNRRIALVLFVVNAALYTLVIATTRREEGSNDLYRINQAIISATFCFLFLAAFIYGCRLYRAVASGHASQPETASGKRMDERFKKVTNKLRRIGLILTCLFLLRTFVFSWYPLTGGYSFGPVDFLLYPWSFYHVCDLITSIIVAYDLLPPNSPPVEWSTRVCGTRCCCCGEPSLKHSSRGSLGSGGPMLTREPMSPESARGSATPQIMAAQPQHPSAARGSGPALGPTSV